MDNPNLVQTKLGSYQKDPMIIKDEEMSLRETYEITCTKKREYKYWLKELRKQRKAAPWIASPPSSDAEK